MKINMDNYEAWLLDYMEGNLSPEDTALLLKFLAINPDLRPDFIELDKIKPEPAPAFSEKIFLKKTGIAEIDSIDAFEKTCILATENQLDKEDRQQFDNYLSHHVQMRKTYNLYAKTHLMPDESVVFDGKGKLKHLKVSKGRVIAWSSMATAAAATIALVFMLRMPDETKIQVAQEVVKPMKTEIVSQPLPSEVKVSKKEQKARPAIVKKYIQIAQKTDSTVNVNKNLREEEIGLEPLLAIEAAPLENVEAEVMAHLPVEYLKTNLPVDKENFNGLKYLTLPELASNRFNEFVKGNGINAESTLNFWTAANFALKKINQVAGTDLKLKKAYDEKNDKVIYVMKSDLFSFYREKRK